VIKFGNCFQILSQSGLDKHDPPLGREVIELFY
jgi:hypothetical protein